MSVTNKYELESIEYGVQGWHNILTNNNDLLDAAIQTYVRYKVASGEHVRLTDCKPVTVKDGLFYKVRSGERCVGIIISGESVTSGEYILAQRAGVFTNPYWNWSKSGEIYIGVNGELTEVMPATNPWLYHVGAIGSPTTIIIEL